MKLESQELVAVNEEIKWEPERIAQLVRARSKRYQSKIKKISAEHLPNLDGLEDTGENQLLLN